MSPAHVISGRTDRLEKDSTMPLAASTIVPFPHPTSPEAFPAAFAGAFNRGDLDAVASHDDEASVLNLGAGKVLRGIAGIRPALAQFLAPGLPIVVTSRFIVSTGSRKTSRSTSPSRRPSTASTSADSPPRPSGRGSRLGSSACR